MRTAVLFTAVFALVGTSGLAQTREGFAVGGDLPWDRSRDITVVQTWDYPVSDYGFGLGIKYEGIGAGNIWITDWGSTPGFYEFDRSGSLQAGFIPAIDANSTQDCAYIIDDDIWVVGYYGDNYIDFYDDSGIVDSVPGPPGWTDVWGVAYSNDENNVIYLGQTDVIAYGTYTDPGTDISWTDLHLGDGVGRVSGLGYYAPGGRTAEGRYLFGVARTTDPWGTTLFVWRVNDNGRPLTNVPAYVFDLSSFLTPDSLTGGIEWDGQHLWVLDQPVEDTDYVIEFDLGLDDTNITPMSLGNIKASFR